jgi:hypothetical protein
MPPIMGAGAFVMASYTSIPYSTIVSVSIIPAFLYFLSVAFIVRIEAVKHQVGEGIDLVVNKGKLISGGLVFVLPSGGHDLSADGGVTPSYAASWAIAALVVVSWFTSIAARFVGPGYVRAGADGAVEDRRSAADRHQIIDHDRYPAGGHRHHEQRHRDQRNRQRVLADDRAVVGRFAGDRHLADRPCLAGARAWGFR